MYNSLKLNILPPPISQNELSGMNNSGATPALLTKALHLVGRAFLCLCLMSLPLLTGCSQDDTPTPPDNTPSTSVRTAAPSNDDETDEEGGMSRTDEVADPYSEVY